MHAVQWKSKPADKCFLWAYHSRVRTRDAFSFTKQALQVLLQDSYVITQLVELLLLLLVGPTSCLLCSRSHQPPAAAIETITMQLLTLLHVTVSDQHRAQDRQPHSKPRMSTAPKSK